MSSSTQAVPSQECSIPRQASWLIAHRSWLILVLLIAVSIVVFTAMNWRLWFNLRIPHGDSAMYEEHLWNLTHGKGFRSYLDQGLFLGEHIQVIHLLLLPLHVVWPSHLLLDSPPVYGVPVP